MPGIRESRASVTLEYDAEPPILAEACQWALNAVGKVKSIQRETGIITGRVSSQMFVHNAADVTVQIKKTEMGTQAAIDATAGEPLLRSADSAQKCIAKLINYLAQHPALKGRSKAGW